MLGALEVFARKLSSGPTRKSFTRQSPEFLPVMNTVASSWDESQHFCLSAALRQPGILYIPFRFIRAVAAQCNGLHKQQEGKGVQHFGPCCTFSFFCQHHSSTSQWAYATSTGLSCI